MNLVRHAVVPVVLVVLAFAGAVSAQEQSEIELGRQVRLLTAKVRSLEAEQQRLLVQKTLVSADSKYLELDLVRGEGALMYRTRVLRTFRFHVHGRFREREGEDGILAMTSKEEGTASRRRLLFGNGLLIIEGKINRPVTEGGTPSLSLGKRDLAALYYALEPGSIALLQDLTSEDSARQHPGGIEAIRTGVHGTAASVP